METDRMGVTMTEDGYVAAARCGKGHSGNRRLGGIEGNGQYACVGCSQYYSAGEVLAIQAAPAGTGSNMSAHLYRPVGEEV